MEFVSCFSHNLGERDNRCHSYHIIARVYTIKSTNIKCWRSVGKTERTLLHHWWDCKLVQPIWTTGWMFLKKLNIELPYYPVIPLLGIYPEKTINVQKDTYTPIFIAALFKIAKTWNQPKWQLRMEQIKNMWGVCVCVCVCVCTAKYYSGMRKKK